MTEATRSLSARAGPAKSSKIGRATASPATSPAASPHCPRRWPWGVPTLREIIAAFQAQRTDPTFRDVYDAVARLAASQEAGAA